MVKLLIKYGVFLEVKDVFGFILLFYVCGRVVNVEIVKYFIEECKVFFVFWMYVGMMCLYCVVFVGKWSLVVGVVEN